MGERNAERVLVRGGGRRAERDTAAVVPAGHRLAQESEPGKQAFCTWTVEVAGRAVKGLMEYRRGIRPDRSSGEN